MRFGPKLLKVLLMLFVFSGQVMAADGASSCDMDIHEMSMIDHDNMDMPNSDMDTDKMDCCDLSCALDCSLSMTIALVESTSIEAQQLLASSKIDVRQDQVFSNSQLVLFRPPISA